MLSALLRYAGKVGYAYPSDEELQNAVGCSKTTLWRTRNKLIKKGWLEVERTKHGYIYTVVCVFCKKEKAKRVREYRH